MSKRYNPIEALVRAGISFDDAAALRRISMTLQRWHELECGDSNAYSSWSITRGQMRDGDFHYDDDGAPHLETHSHTSNTRTRYVPIPDRENGARKRLAAIMARYPGYQAYVQGDPRGCAVHVLRPEDIRPGDDISSVYTRGVAVCK